MLLLKDGLGSDVWLFLDWSWMGKAANISKTIQSSVFPGDMAVSWLSMRYDVICQSSGAAAVWRQIKGWCHQPTRHSFAKYWLGLSLTSLNLHLTFHQSVVEQSSHHSLESVFTHTVVQPHYFPRNLHHAGAFQPCMRSHIQDMTWFSFPQNLQFEIHHCMSCVSVALRKYSEQNT